MTGTRIIRIVLIVVLVETVIVVAILLSPGFRDSATGMAVRVADAWVGSEESTGMLGRLSNGVGDLYTRRVAPLLGTDYEPSQAGNPFSECNACHTDYATRARFGDLFMDHPAHAALGLSCESCHTDIAHPRPLPPPESICAECHTDVATGGDCTTCHAPASLPHYTVLGASRTGPVDCDTCHLPGSIGGGASTNLIDHPPLDGQDSELCLTCHQETTCSRCHDSAHPADWIDTHPISVGPRGPAVCTTCHTLAWCSDACHSTVKRLLPLPIGEEE